jgi:glutathione S-transferase
VNYVELEEAQGRPGLRLVLTAGVPGPWGEAAKGILAVKQIPYTPVRQPPEGERELLLRWTRQTSAPVAMYEEERPRSGWSEILFLAERLAPEPRLVPRETAERALMLGLCFEICGEQGLGWSRRLSMLPPGPSPDFDTMPWRYGLSEADRVAGGDARVNELLALLASQLHAQHAAGRRYLVGEQLSAVDIYWAAFSNLIQPLPDEQCPMPDWLRPIYAPGTRPIDAPDPLLIEHRDHVWEKHLGLPMDF